MSQVQRPTVSFTCLGYYLRSSMTRSNQICPGSRHARTLSPDDAVAVAAVVAAVVVAAAVACRTSAAA